MSTDREPQTSLTKLKRFSYASDTWQQQQQRVDQRLWNNQAIIMEHNDDDDDHLRPPPPSLANRQNGYEDANEESFLSWEVEEFSTGLLAVSNAFAHPKEELQPKNSVSIEGSLQRLSRGAAPPAASSRQAQSDDITPKAWDPNVESARWSRSVPFLLLPSGHESERSGEEDTSTTTSSTLSSSLRVGLTPKKAIDSSCGRLVARQDDANFRGQRKVRTYDRASSKNIDDKLKEFKKDLRSMNQSSATSRKARPGSVVTPMAAIAEENHLAKSIELIGDGGRTVHVDLYRHVAARPTTNRKGGNATTKEKSRKGQQQQQQHSTKGVVQESGASSDRRNPFRNLRRLLGLSTGADTSTQWRFHSLRHFPSSLSWNRGSSSNAGKEARTGFLHGTDYCAASQELLNSSSVNVKELAEIRISEDNTERDSIALSDSMGPRSGTISSTRSSNYLTASMTDCSTLTKQHSNAKLNPIEEETSKRSAKSSETYSNEATLQQGTQRASLLYLSTIGYICHNFPKRANLWWRRHGRCGTSSKLCWKDVTLRSNKPVLVSRIAVYYDGFMSVGAGEEANVTAMVVPAKYKNPWPKTRPMPFTLPCVVEMRENLNSELLCCQECWQANTVCTHSEEEHQQCVPCTVYILPKATLCTTKQVVNGYARTLADQTTTAEQLVSVVNKFNFLMIQLITVFKFLQSMGIEETKNDLEDIVVMQMEADRMPRVTLEWDSVFIDERMTSNNRTVDSRPKLPLCKVAAAQLVEILNVLNDRCADGANLSSLSNVNKWYAVFPLFKIGLAKAAHVLFEGKCDALTRAQTLLQYLFWVAGKTDRLTTEDRARIWLDNQRVALLCHLVKRMLNPLYEIDVEEHYRLLFLLHASSKSLLEAEKMTFLLRSSNETTT
ncbi:hypothetical protein TTRE_0000012301 [Trichuris trichiura]|uniref:Uncharacterized protein n=1 Tax=Trichuris trichiura TaxID=36087 RepID=A0A077YVS9_TRITR|nr:hypothetical protein TTRE_0000012301 [Trichuris trichiura]